MNNKNNELKIEFESLLDSFPAHLAPSTNTLVTGTVVQKSGNGYFVDIGMKSESFIDEISDCDTNQIDIGCRYQFFVTGPQDENGSIPLSRSKAIQLQDLDLMRHTKTISLVRINSISNSRTGRASGLNATINGIKAFIPKSEIPARQKLVELVDQKIAVCIINIDVRQEPGPVVILSHSKALDSMFIEQVESFSPSTTVRCKVVAVMPAGVRVQIVSNGLMGFVPRSELAFDRKSRPHKIVEKDDFFDAQILTMDMASQSIVLSRRQSIQSQFLAGLSLGQKLKGRICRENDYAFFVEVGNCLDAILYKKDCHKKHLRPQDEINAYVISIKQASGKLVLGLDRQSISA